MTPVLEPLLSKVASYFSSCDYLSINAVKQKCQRGNLFYAHASQLHSPCGFTLSSCYVRVPGYNGSVGRQVPESGIDYGIIDYGFRARIRSGALGMP